LPLSTSGTFGSFSVENTSVPLLLLLALLVAGGARPAAAQTPVPLTIEAAVERGLAEAPRIAEARARVAAADAAVASRGALGRPTVSAFTSYLRTNHVTEFGVTQPDGRLLVLYPDIPDNFRVRAEMAVPVFTSGRVEALVASARAEGRAADADRRTVEADVALDVARAYWSLVLARESVIVLQQSLARADASVSDVRARVDAGLLPPNDLLSSQAQRARQQVRLIQSQHDATLAEADLGRLVGADPGQPIATTTPIDRPIAAAAALAAMNVDALVERARQARSERDGLQERAAALRATALASGAGRRPQVSALAAVEPATPNPRFFPRTDAFKTSWDLGVTVSWALLDGGRSKADAAAATAQAAALGHRLEDFDAGVRIEVRQRVLDLESNRAALAASGEAVAAATEARRVVEERFAAGVATSTDVIDAQVALLEAALERTRIEAGLRFGEARLIRTVGGR
jgi:outer membrane protein TolC